MLPSDYDTNIDNSLFKFGEQTPIINRKRPLKTVESSSQFMLPQVYDHNIDDSVFKFGEQTPIINRKRTLKTTESSLKYNSSLSFFEEIKIIVNESKESIDSIENSKKKRLDISGHSLTINKILQTEDDDLEHKSLICIPDQSLKDSEIDILEAKFKLLNLND
jgi:hypothetical protein